MNFGGGEGFMDKCVYSASCTFVNEELNDMPYTKNYFLDMYCKSDFKACPNYQLSDYSHASDNLLNRSYVSSLIKFNRWDTLPWQTKKNPLQ
jgi:hypothetical protein